MSWSEAGRDLGALVDEKLNKSQLMAKRATQFLVQYSDVVWPHLESCRQFGAPESKVDIKNTRMRPKESNRDGKRSRGDDL